MSFRDRTWCTDMACEKFKTCDKSLTDKVDAEARTWWGKKDYPIMMFAGRIECYQGDPNEPYEHNIQGERP